MLSACERASATPAEIIFLRHAEKPTEGSELNPRGWERAKALATLEPLLAAPATAGTPPDAWVLAALAAVRLGSVSHASVFLRRAVAHGTTGYGARHRAARSRELSPGGPACGAG